MSSSAHASQPVVRIARGASEREEAFRLRYQVLVDELGKDLRTADNKRRIVEEPEDEHATILVAHLEDRAVATFRLNFGKHGVTEDQQRTLGFSDIGGFDLDSVACCARLVVLPESRGASGVLSAIVCDGYRQLLAEGAELNFVHCTPALIPMYEALGFRRYRANVIVEDAGYQVPLVLVVRDLGHLERVGSAFLAVARSEGVAPVSEAWFGELFPEYASQVALGFAAQDSDWDDLTARLTETRPVLFRDLDPDEVRKITACASVLSCVEGDRVIREGDVSNELYVVLSGVAEARKKNGESFRLLATHGEGDVFGEIAFASRVTRTADVVALTSLEVMVLSVRSLQKLAASEPQLAFRLMLNLSVVLCDRLHRRTQAWAEER